MHVSTCYCSVYIDNIRIRGEDSDDKLMEIKAICQHGSIDGIFRDAFKKRQNSARCAVVLHYVVASARFELIEDHHVFGHYGQGVSDDDCNQHISVKDDPQDSQFRQTEEYQNCRKRKGNGNVQDDYVVVVSGPVDWRYGARDVVGGLVPLAG